VTLPFKSSSIEQYAIIVLLWEEKLDANQIYSQMHPVYGDKCFMKPSVHI